MLMALGRALEQHDTSLDDFLNSPVIS
jgi:hypothetical protein